MNDDQIKILEELRDGHCQQAGVFALTGVTEMGKFHRERCAALAAAIDYIRDTSEVLEAAVSVGFQSHFLTRISQETWVMHSDGSSNGIQSDSALSAWRETQEKNK